MPHPQADVRFDHTIIAARDRRESARFFTEIFGLPEPREAG
jgi:catechol 2,3-dioxygenase-like lactoylglutathione lyase family enzyme